ncbi:MAG: ribonuclease H-like domain-containing protein, partial [Oscillospiraceae bacterium]|nr:ribonuclease H-like domain-containing protein [Oscillospiraceae bacterium]
MHYIQETHIWDNYTSNAFDMYFQDCKICVLDIETTGLSPGRSHFILGGLLSLEEGEARLSQFFAESLSEEKQLLAEYVSEAEKYDVLLTYNGKHFDIPFLLSRADQLELDIFAMPYNLDLYLVLNGHSSLRKLLPNLKQ